MTYLDFTDLDGLQGEIRAIDIGNGQSGNCEVCPVAIALGYMFEGCEIHVTLETATVYEYGGDVCTVLCISERLAEWIDAYDHEKPVVPVSLQIYTWNVKGYDYMLDIADVSEPT